ncbi:MAG: SH3 domain-containing protein [Peptococcaceae bacterium]|nr:SH3 domain-containing protein [Peptococcaceae bacterium]
MRRKKFIVAMAIVVLYIGSLGSARAFSPQPGTQDDPLITVSYLTQVLQPLLARISALEGFNTSTGTLITTIQQLEARVAQLETKIVQMQGTAPTIPTTPTTPTTPTPTAPSPPVILYGFINGKMVNIRTGAGTNFSIIVTLPMNTRLEVLEKGKVWHKVKYQDSVGYVSSEFFRIP